MSSKDKKRSKKRGAKKRQNALTAATADRHVLYENSVQAVDAEIDFVDGTFTQLRGRHAATLREDFCGTANTSCEWIRRRPDNFAIGVDLDEQVMDWGRQRHIAALDDPAKERIQLLNADVVNVDTHDQDIVLAMNFSYWAFTKRAKLRDYFVNVRRSLNDDGIFFLDCYGGYEAFCVMKEHTDYDGYRYTWDQAAYNPITGDLLCHIHFKFDDGSRLKKAFTYEWRLWTLPEIREILEEAGFSRVTVHWQGWDDDEEEASGEFFPAENADADAGWLCYIVAER
jgi:cyclopropane fatty-acyl-phospholipid synthase-like methyltransferase